MAKNLVRIESNERIDLTDFELLANTVMEDVQRDQGDQFFCDPARDRKWVIDGFAMDNPAAKQLRVTLGKAILAYRSAGVIQYGMLTTAGDATKTVDLNGWAAATYGIYVRFQYVPGTSQSRIFWDPTGTGTEFAQTINTKFHSNWSLRVESSNPGDEWLKIGEVAQATMTITDQRGLYFEGEVHNNYESGWSTEGGGIANDRNADRQQYGVTDLQMFSAAMRQCLEDIKGRGLRRWWEKDIGGMNIGFDAAPVEDKLAIGNANFNLYFTGTESQVNFTADEAIFHDTADPEGTPTLDFKVGGSIEFRMSGASLGLYPETTDVRDLGGTLNKFRDLRLSRAAYAPTVYVDLLNISNAAAEGCNNHFVPESIDSWDLGNSTYRWRDLFLAHGVIAGGTTNPAAGDGIFTNGLAVGYDGAPAADEIRLGDAASRLVAVAATGITLYGGAGNYYGVSQAANLHSWTVGTALKMHLSTTVLYPNADDTIGLGDATHRCNISYFKGLRAPAVVDPAGLANWTTFAGITDETLDTGVGAVLMKTANPGNSSGWLKFYKGVDAPTSGARWIPYWENISP